MKTSILCLCLVLSGTPVVEGITPPGSVETDLVRLVLGDSLYSACGLDKLTSEERLALLDALGGVSSESFLDESAAKFLYAEGWREIQVVGYRRLNPDGIGVPDDYLIVWSDTAINILDPPIGGEDLAPGFYWAKGPGASWDILSPSGKKLHFWVEKTI